MTLFELDHQAHRPTALCAGRRLVSLYPRRLAAELAQYITPGTAFMFRPGSTRVIVISVHRHVLHCRNLVEHGSRIRRHGGWHQATIGGEDQGLVAARRCIPFFAHARSVAAHEDQHHAPRCAHSEVVKHHQGDEPHGSPACPARWPAERVRHQRGTARSGDSRVIGNGTRIHHERGHAGQSRTGGVEADAWSRGQLRGVRLSALPARPPGRRPRWRARGPTRHRRGHSWPVSPSTEFRPTSTRSNGPVWARAAASARAVASVSEPAKFSSHRWMPAFAPHAIASLSTSSAGGGPSVITVHEPPESSRCRARRDPQGRRSRLAATRPSARRYRPQHRAAAVRGGGRAGRRDEQELDRRPGQEWSH